MHTLDLVGACHADVGAAVAACACAYAGLRPSDNYTVQQHNSDSHRDNKNAR